MAHATSAGAQTEETLDRLTESWSIVQLRRGHRFSTDDVLAAWAGLRAAPQATHLLDLCAGVGSIGLLGLWGRPGAQLTSVEVQQVSHDLYRKTLALNDIEHRVTAIRRDLRDFQGPRFDLVTANPPYLPAGTGAQSPHPQRAAARLELHGDVFDVCRVAAAHLAPGGRFVLCFGAADPRPPQALSQAGLPLLQHTSVVFRAGDAPMVSLYVAGHGEPTGDTRLTIRDQGGEWTEDWLGIRRKVGLDR
jgi:tRNA1(Val) A37 N6-methylase TrmN6